MQKVKILHKSCKINHVGQIYHNPDQTLWLTMTEFRTLLTKKGNVDPWEEDEDGYYRGYEKHTIPYRIIGRFYVASEV